MSVYSVSRLKKFEQCPQAFKFTYLSDIPRTRGNSGDFGSTAHKVLEKVYSWAVKRKFKGFLPEERLEKIYHKVFSYGVEDRADQKIRLTGEDQYKLGLSILKRYFKKHEVNGTSVLDIEKEFRFKYKGYQFLGFIDRLDISEPGIVDITDYKTSKWLFSREEMDNDLQMTVYGWAVREMYSDVREVHYGYEMLTHGIRLFTYRTLEGLREGMDYAVALIKRIEHDETFEAKLSILCHWCDHKSICPEYLKALHGEVEVPSLDTNLETLAEAREKLAAGMSVMERRKKEIDQVLLTHIQKSPTGELVFGDRVFSLSQRTLKEISLDKAVQFIKGACETPLSDKEIIKNISSLEKGKMEEYIKSLDLSESEKESLFTKIEMASKVRAGNPYITTRTKKIHSVNGY